MKATWSMLLGLFCICFLMANAHADAKEVTLTGKLTCAKCGLKEATSCHTVIVVTKDGKDTVYYIDKKSPDYKHKEVCQGEKEGSVTGTVATKNGKHYIKASKITFND